MLHGKECLLSACIYLISVKILIKLFNDLLFCFFAVGFEESSEPKLKQMSRKGRKSGQS